MLNEWREILLAQAVWYPPLQKPQAPGTPRSRNGKESLKGWERRRLRQENFTIPRDSH